MPLNYSKWDQLELSDDSDIEGHPNVDKRSLIRWKQRDIHEQREARKHKIASLKIGIECDEVLLKRLKTISETLSSASGPPATENFSSLIKLLKEQPSPDAPPVNSLGQAPTTFDEMILSLLLQVQEEAKKSVDDVSSDAFGKAVIEGINQHIKKLSETIETHRHDLAVEEKEKAKRITVEDLHDGFDSKYVPPKPAPAPLTKQNPITTTTTYETLNPKASDSSSKQPISGAEDDMAETELPKLTPSLTVFSHIPLYNYQQSWQFIQDHRDVVVQGASDALLVAAFRAENEGKSKYAKQCVHQSLLLQYCDKLGPDGVRIFFKKMITGDNRAQSVFVDDVERTYKSLVTRVAASRAEAAAEGFGTEQIQLVPENHNQTISFNVPDGPPPENLVLEGPGTEDLDVEEVRRVLQLRWELFQGFSDDLQNALRAGELDNVNKVLGAMSVEEAESVVKRLDMAGILNFAEGGVRDETGKGKEVQREVDDAGEAAG